MRGHPTRTWRADRERYARPAGREEAPRRVLDEHFTAETPIEVVTAQSKQPGPEKFWQLWQAVIEDPLAPVRHQVMIDPCRQAAWRKVRIRGPHASFRPIVPFVAAVLPRQQWTIRALSTVDGPFFNLSMNACWSGIVQTAAVSRSSVFLALDSPDPRTTILLPDGAPLHRGTGRSIGTDRVVCSAGALAAPIGSSVVGGEPLFNRT